MEDIPDKIGPQKIAHLEKQNQKMREALEEISKNGRSELNHEYCHWEGCNSPKIAQEALKEVDNQ